jgi:cyclohexanone monooxygenase
VDGRDKPGHDEVSRRMAVPDTNYDAIIVGAGFSGLYMLHRLRGLGFSARVYERGSGVGGTWYWNRYPGARCDVESVQYSYSFSDALQQDWQWTERYAGQPEILRYANHVADRFDLRRDIAFNTSVLAADFDKADNRWRVILDNGSQVSAQHLVMAVGCLSNARLPDFPGLASFRGKVFHTGEWPHEGVDFSGLRVGVVGTGSSAIQSIPVIAEQAKHVTVFQRTPNYSIPARNSPLSDDEKRAWADNYRELRRRAREEMRNGIVSEIPQKGALEDDEDAREATYEFRWERGGLTFMTAYNNLALDKVANDTAADFVRKKIAATVKNAAVAKLLQPTSYPIGTKRICIDTDYFETFNRDNVTLVDIRNAPITEIRPNGIVSGGKEYEADAIVFATGFDAMTGSFARIDIRGRDGLTLKEKWEAGPKTYLGLMVAGFPNMYLITGPGSPSVLSNMMVSIEQHVDWVADCVAYLHERDVACMEATQDAEDRWVAHVNEVAHKTLYPQANSWYMGANIPGKPRVFLPYIGGIPAYRAICNEVAANGYRGFALTRQPRVAAAE